MAGQRQRILSHLSYHFSDRRLNVTMHGASSSGPGSRRGAKAVPSLRAVVRLNLLAGELFQKWVEEAQS